MLRLLCRMKISLLNYFAFPTSDQFVRRPHTLMFPGSYCHGSLISKKKLLKLIPKHSDLENHPLNTLTLKLIPKHTNLETSKHGDLETHPQSH
jgi:hypothetical protein